MHRFTAIALVTALLAVFGTSAPAAAQEPTRGIVNITGELYRAQNDNHYNVFLVTPDGIIMTDPINREFSLWLKEELDRRFGVPVRYVLYSHSDWDHASGGVVFADTAEFVGHESMPEAIALPAGNLPLSGDAQRMDANRNGLVERAEATGTLADRFALTDENGDGVLSGAEVARGAVNDVHLPTITFSDRHEVALGGRRAVLVHAGVAHSPDSTIIHFPAERAVFGADILQVRRLPGGLTPTAGAWIDMMETVLALDFEHAATGHALMGTRQDMVDLMQYLQDISRGVAAGVGAGRSLKEIQQSLTLDAYKGWDRYDTNRANHIAQIYETLQGAP